MTKILLAVAMLCGSAALVSTPSTSLADILRPPTVKTRTITGKKAHELYDAMNVPTLRGDSLRTQNSNYKVVRTATELKQTICEETNYTIPAGKPSTYRCTIQTSIDGSKVPAFHPAIRMG
jgi:hypothetical protein